MTDPSIPALALTSPFHAGEQRVQERLGVRDIEAWARKVVRDHLPEEHRTFHAALPFLVAGADPSRAVPFDRTRNIGLHHLALAVEGQTALDALCERLRRVADVELEFAPEPLGGGPTRHMMVRILGGIRVELISKAG